jgi:hypothetical protein
MVIKLMMMMVLVMIRRVSGQPYASNDNSDDNNISCIDLNDLIMYNDVLYVRINSIDKLY